MQRSVFSAARDDDCSGVVSEKYTSANALCDLHRASHRLHGCGAWGFSSAGRAPALQAGGQRFESVILHGFEIIDMLGTRNDFFCQKQFTLRTPVVVSRVENRAEEPRFVEIYEEKGKANKGAWGMPVALGGDEGRDKLRKAAVSGKCAMTRRCPNGETRHQRW